MAFEGAFQNIVDYVAQGEGRVLVLPVLWSARPGGATYLFRDTPGVDCTTLDCPMASFYTEEVLLPVLQSRGFFSDRSCPVVSLSTGLVVNTAVIQGEAVFSVDGDVISSNGTADLYSTRRGDALPKFPAGTYGAGSDAVFDPHNYTTTEARDPLTPSGAPWFATLSGSVDMYALTGSCSSSEYPTGVFCNHRTLTTTGPFPVGRVFQIDGVSWGGAFETVTFKVIGYGMENADANGNRLFYTSLDGQEIPLFIQEVV